MRLTLACGVLTWCPPWWGDPLPQSNCPRGPGPRWQITSSQHHQRSCQWRVTHHSAALHPTAALHPHTDRREGRGEREFKFSCSDFTNWDRQQLFMIEGRNRVRHHTACPWWRGPTVCIVKFIKVNTRQRRGQCWPPERGGQVCSFYAGQSSL